MKTSVLLVVVVAVTCGAYEQVQYSATVVPGENGGCPADAMIQQIKQDVRNILSTFSFPPGGNSTNDTMANGTYSGDGVFSSGDGAFSSGDGAFSSGDGTFSCKGSSGWNRIAYLDMSIPTTQCPSTWREVITSSTPARACGGLVIGDRACDSNVYPNTQGLAYSQVCGRMVGYQLSAPDAFRPYQQGFVTTIESAYLDGVSLTHGAEGSRQHIWSFAVGESEDSSTLAACPCNPGTSAISPPFVGNDYFCESGVPMENCSRIYFGNDPLWDGMSCNVLSSCCAFNAPPYFTKTLPSPTTDDLEVRLCSYDEGCASDIAVSLIELYVK